MAPRPARGYHKFRNGLLNVKPKGAETQITSNNSEQSPLLTLPAEIRNRIWGYVVGEKTIVIRWKKFEARDKEKHCHSILRVCRQTYLETATLPFSLNIFVFSDDGVIKKLKPYQRENLTQIQLLIGVGRDDLWMIPSIPSFPKVQLVGIKCISCGSHVSEENTRRTEESIKGAYPHAEVTFTWDLP
ncbi:hypothetical protein BDV95DRAFT_656695 [Massariosphaeria phaeospora]|uniref:Uncharacterized protein n=1 Tax=Massariosphaeria phaeospora TaxID=100035 RepID=A0A7C8MEG8_9PLEO|nr:hypothetical protein BDV95DRAFT_656695 [Massariosphaeria phaeospora]